MAMTRYLLILLVATSTMLSCGTPQKEKSVGPVEDPCAYCLLENARPSSLGNGPFLSKTKPAFDSVQHQKLADYFNHNLDSAFALCAEKYPEAEGLSKARKDSLLTAIQLWYTYYNIDLPDTLNFPETPDEQGNYQMNLLVDTVFYLDAVQYRNYLNAQFHLGDSLLDYREIQLRNSCAALLGKKAEEINDAMLISAFYRGRHLSTDASIQQIRMTDSAYAKARIRFNEIDPQNFK
jgi:hypothetical protein